MQSSKTAIKKRLIFVDVEKWLTFGSKASFLFSAFLGWRVSEWSRLWSQFNRSRRSCHSPFPPTLKERRTHRNLEQFCRSPLNITETVNLKACCNTHFRCVSCTIISFEKITLERYLSLNFRLCIWIAHKMSFYVDYTVLTISNINLMWGILFSHT